MTTNTKDITELVDQLIGLNIVESSYCSSIRFTELDRLLKKLDHEDLDVLRAMLEEVYESGKVEGTDDRYDEGFDDGYERGYSDHE